MMLFTSLQIPSHRSAMPASLLHTSIAAIPSVFPCCKGLLLRYLLTHIVLLQIRSYVFDVVRGTVPKINLDDVFTVRVPDCHHPHHNLHTGCNSIST